MHAIRAPERYGNLFGFDQADLEANRRGELSARQRGKLQRLQRDRGGSLGGVLMALATFLIGGSALAGSRTLAGSLPWVPLLALCLAVVVGSLTALDAYRRRRNARRLAQAIRDQRIETIRGAIGAGENRSGYPAAYVGQIGAYYLAVGDHLLLFITDHPELIKTAPRLNPIVTAYCIDTGRHYKYLLSLEEAEV